MLARETEPLFVADGVVRLGTELVNWYLVEDDGRVTILDAGAPAYRAQLDRGLALLGRGVGDVAAVLLTHGHGDHIGFAEPVRRELGIPVHVHRDDVKLTTTGKRDAKNEGSVLPYLRYPHAWKLVGHLATAGGVPKPVAEVTTFDDGDELDLPGRPRVVHTPGHTAGHASFYLESRGALVLGDALCSRNPLTGAIGPQLMPRAFNLSSGTTLDSLSKLERLDADVLLFGHGEPWREGAAEAVRRARATGVT
jgi:glyoxylase-like metal-dependent hydrolase (beta-lactamase superfamily II)